MSELDRHHSHFLFVDHGRRREGHSIKEFRQRFERYLSENDISGDQIQVSVARDRIVQRPQIGACALCFAIASWRGATSRFHPLRLSVCDPA